ncbi:beta-CASP ribonuclease aCPSF1 [Candidatus Micrarchaeota archaeon]|nr:beta-CASP ribonuclease aCPSF1 [Candidatus Micrarchaeota archaeon]
MPPECEIVKVDAEGLNIVVYIRNIREFYNKDQLIKHIAGAVKKKVLIRADPSVLMGMEEALSKIKSIVPSEVEITSIRFVPEFSEVHIETLKPGLVIGKGGSTLKEIMLRTNWAPIVLRTPTMPSSTVDGIRKSFVLEAAERKRLLSGVGKRICQQMPKSDWLRVSFLGGFGEVGRSCMLVQTNHSKVIIDCGVNPVTTEPTKAYPYLNTLGFSLDQIDAVIISHGHMDHMGFAPYLYAYGYDGPVYCTPPTRDFMALLQQDYINVLQKSFGVSAPYTKKDIQKELRHVIPVDYGEVVDITPEIKMTLYNAGHILGSALVHLHIGEGLHNLVYSGDIKFGFTRLFDPANVNFPRVETLFVESTYGGRDDMTPPRAESENNLIRIINETIEKKGCVLIPVFAVGRSQEILLVLEDFYKRNPDFNVPIYIDGMVLEASAIHTTYPEYLRDSLEKRILANQSPFESPLIRVAKGEDRETIVNGGEPAIILAPSGMLSGGPSYDYLKRMADNEKNTLIFVGYQSALSLGSKIQKGMREVPIIGADGRTDLLKINMRVETVEGFSGHSDRAQLMAFLKNVSPTPERVYTMHGDGNKSNDLAKSASMMLKRGVGAPLDMEAIRLK